MSPNIKVTTIVDTYNTKVKTIVDNTEDVVEDKDKTVFLLAGLLNIKKSPLHYCYIFQMTSIPVHTYNSDLTVT